MAEDSESSVTETKKVINPRVEIDTSPPFESVKEAVDRFGGGGPWLPLHLLRLAAHQQHGTEVFDIDKVEEQAAELEKDLIMKEQETLDVLKELEAAKRFVESLKVNLVQEVSAAFMASPELKAQFHNSGGGLMTLCPSVSPGLISMELSQAKMSLSKTTTNLALIRASVESLNKKMKAEKILLERTNEKKIPSPFPVEEEEKRNYHHDHFIQATANTTTTTQSFSMSSSKEIQEVNFEADQFKKMTEASRYEVMKAMSEIERTKTSIKMAEMRLTAARKMEEAAKAVEAIAIAERDCQLDHNNNYKNSPQMILQKSEGITLSFEEYSALTRKAQQAEELCKTKFIDSNATVKKLGTTTTTKKVTRRSKNSLEQALDDEDRLARRNLGFEDDSCKETSYQHDQMENLGENAAKFRFRNSHPSPHKRSQPLINGNEADEIKDKSVPVYRPSISIGNILSRKLILQDDIVVGNHVESHEERAEVSLSQMLREQSGLIMNNPTKSMKDGNVDKQFYSSQRKKFGFIHVTFPRQIKKKTQVLNPR